MDAFETLRERGFVEQATDEAGLAERLSAGALTIYCGADPTSDSLHVGHLIPFMALAQLRRAGHNVIVLIGGGTAMIGDPSGKTELRAVISEPEIQANVKAIRVQLERVFADEAWGGQLGTLTFVNNADWWMGMGYIHFLREIGSRFSVNKMLTAEAYKLRLERGLSFIEFNYQLLQAYDFVELYKRLGCSVQIGGSDQWGNIVAGTDLIRRMVGPDARADGLTMPLIMTAAGEKMGKTAKGALFLDPAKTSVFDFYQFWLNVDDRDVGRLLKLYTRLPLAEVDALAALEGAEIREAKRRLALAVTTLVHGAAAAEEAGAAALAMASGAASEALPTLSVAAAELPAEGLSVVQALVDGGLAASKSEARRAIQGGAVRADQDRVDAVDAVLTAEMLGGAGLVLRSGKKKAVRVVLA